MSFSSRLLSASLVLASSLALAGCIVDLDAGGNGGTGGTGGQGGSGGQPGCQSHSDCAGDLICVFSTGECRPPCFDDTQCGTGEECRECVTSACPSCEDCRGACYPVKTGGCDDHTDCPGGLCVFSTGQCAPACSDGACPEGLTCENCATSSGPLLNDCVAACLPAGGGCDSHDDCPDGLCVFSTGLCAAACSGPDGCSAPGEVCDGCATSSCPDCDDCRAACVPGNGKCDTSDDCASGEACHWSEATCRTICSDAGFACTSGFACAECGSSSCPMCEDCIDICLPE